MAKFSIPAEGVVFRLRCDVGDRVLFSREAEPQVGVVAADYLSDDQYFSLIPGTDAFKGQYLIKSEQTGLYLYSRDSAELRVGHNATPDEDNWFELEPAAGKYPLRPHVGGHQNQFRLITPHSRHALSADGKELGNSFAPDPSKNQFFSFLFEKADLYIPPRDRYFRLRCNAHDSVLAFTGVDPGVAPVDFIGDHQYFSIVTGANKFKGRYLIRRKTGDGQQYMYSRTGNIRPVGVDIVTRSDTPIEQNVATAYNWFELQPGAGKHLNQFRLITPVDGYAVVVRGEELTNGPATNPSEDQYFSFMFGSTTDLYIPPQNRYFRLRCNADDSVLFSRPTVPQVGVVAPDFILDDQYFSIVPCTGVYHGFHHMIKGKKTEKFLDRHTRTMEHTTVTVFLESPARFELQPGTGKYLNQFRIITSGGDVVSVGGKKLGFGTATKFSEDQYFSFMFDSIPDLYIPPPDLYFRLCSDVNSTVLFMLDGSPSAELADQSSERQFFKLEPCNDGSQGTYHITDRKNNFMLFSGSSTKPAHRFELQPGTGERLNQFRLVTPSSGQALWCRGTEIRTTPDTNPSDNQFFSFMFGDITIDRVEYDLSRSKILSAQPLVLINQTLRNDSLVTQTLEFTQTVSVTNTSSFDFSAGFSLMVGAKGKAGIPFVAEGEVSVEATASTNFTWGKTDSYTQTHEIKFPIATGPKSAARAVSTATQGSIEVPYVMYSKSQDGHRFTTKGIWHGVSTWNIVHQVYTMVLD